MIQEVVQTQQTEVEKAVADLCARLKKDPASYNCIIFFATSSINFQELQTALHQRFPAAQIIGTTTSGEITAQGFTTNTIVLNAISDSQTSYSAVLIDDANKFPIIAKDKVLSAASKIGINLASPDIHKNSFAVSLICGLKNIEEGFLSMFYSLVADKDFIVCGGTAGDDLKFKATYVCANGECSDSGAVLLFVKTTRQFEIYKENIFQKSGKSVRLTDVVHETHVVRTIDGVNPRKRYAEIIGIPESSANDAILDHPFGRTFGDNVFIASLVSFDSNGILSTYARVIQDSVQEILDPMDPIKITEESCKNIIKKIPNPSCVILFNCILRTIGFSNKKQQTPVNDIWKQYFPAYSGFSTYGEQYGHVNSNQTLVALVLGE
ncbi:MAG: hypothetical protein J5726_06585 [Treponema sp.]|nr:hypothetical protein [Treponema sp.]